MSQGTDKQDVAKRIIEVQKKLGINSRTFAISIGMDPSQMGKIEKAKLGITSKHADKINEVFGVSVSWLLTGKGEKGVWNKVPQAFVATSETDNPIGEIEERLLRIEAHLEVFENAIAGLITDSKKNEKGDKPDFFKIVDELRATVQGVVSRHLAELKKKSSSGV